MKRARDVGAPAAADLLPFPWLELLPELRSRIRWRLCVSAALALALTCHDELGQPLGVRRYIQRTSLHHVLSEESNTRLLTKLWCSLSTIMLHKLYTPEELAEMLALHTAARRDEFMAAHWYFFRTKPSGMVIRRHPDLRLSFCSNPRCYTPHSAAGGHVCTYRDGSVLHKPPQ